MWCVPTVASALETMLAFTDQCLYRAEHIRALADNFVTGEHFICEARDAIVDGIVGGNGRPDLEEILRVLHRIQPTVPQSHVLFCVGISGATTGRVRRMSRISLEVTPQAGSHVRAFFAANSSTKYCRSAFAISPRLAAAAAAAAALVP